MNLTILYRGPLASCNFDCPYCPFAKRHDPPELLRADRAALDRFVDWVERNPDRDQASILFTPWGEALTRRWYRGAIVSLSRLPHVRRVAIQTNLSSRLGWLADADLNTAALWATYHPGQVSEDRFVAACAELDRIGARYSVGVVAQPEHLDAARSLRARLRPDVYLWANAAEGYAYSDAEVEPWMALDPLFAFSVHPHASRGHECRAGESVISVAGDGTVRRCHFIDEPLGNLYDGTYRAGLRPRPCVNEICDCHIGYVHMRRLPLYEVFGAGVLERIPHGPVDDVWRNVSGVDGSAQIRLLPIRPASAPG